MVEGGVVKKWFREKRFGFIKPDYPGGDDIFCHANQLVGVTDLEPGMRVRFETVTGKAGRLSAQSVEVEK